MSAAKDQAATREAETTAPKPRVRDRIFDTACELFYRHGIRAVGVDSIAAEAGTNKMSFYRNFPSKDELVAEYLRDREREYWEFWDATMARHPGDPRRQIEALFEAHMSTVKEKTCRGCALGNAAVELDEEDGVLAQVVQGYKKEVRRRLRKLAHELGAREPDTLGDAMMLLLDGAYFTRLVFPGNSGPSAALMSAVHALLDAHLPGKARSGATGH